MVEAYKLLAEKAVESHTTAKRIEEKLKNIP